MTDLFRLILVILASRFKARATLEAENLVLRQQVNVLRRRTPKRPHLNNADRFLFVWLYRWFPSVLEVVCTENLNPNVLTMKSAQYGARIYDAGSLNLARDRRIFVQ